MPPTSNKLHVDKRKSNKPEMERRRRERMNETMERLKGMILLYENKDVSRYAKMEKAEVLELTEEHVRELHTRIPPLHQDDHQHFKTGYKQCISDIQKLLQQFPFLPPQVTDHLISNLEESLQKQIPKSNGSKVRATLDSSVLRSDVLRLDSTPNREQASLNSATLKKKLHHPLSIPAEVGRSGLLTPPIPEQTSPILKERYEEPHKIASIPVGRGLLTPPDSRGSSSPDSTFSPSCSPDAVFYQDCSMPESRPYRWHSPAASIGESSKPINLSVNITRKDEDSCSSCSSSDPSPSASPTIQVERLQVSHNDRVLSNSKYANHRFVPYQPAQRRPEVRHEPNLSGSSVWRPF